MTITRKPRRAIRRRKVQSKRHRAKRVPAATHPKLEPSFIQEARTTFAQCHEQDLNDQVLAQVALDTRVSSQCREMALSGIHRQDILIRLLPQLGLAPLRLKALQTLSSTHQSTIARLALEDKAPSVSLEAISRLRDQKTLKAIVLRSESYQKQHLALRYITDHSILKSIWTQTNDTELHIAIATKLKDHQWLCQLASDSHVPLQHRAEAARAIHHKPTLESLLADTTLPPTVRATVLKNMGDQALCCQIATNPEASPPLRAAAVRAISERGLLVALVANPSLDQELRNLALDLIYDQYTRQSIATNTALSVNLRVQALSILMDQSFLKHLAGNPETPEELRVRAQGLIREETTQQTQAAPYLSPSPMIAEAMLAKLSNDPSPALAHKVFDPSYLKNLSEGRDPRIRDLAQLQLNTLNVVALMCSGDEKTLRGMALGPVSTPNQELATQALSGQDPLGLIRDALAYRLRQCPDFTMQLKILRQLARFARVTQIIFRDSGTCQSTHSLIHRSLRHVAQISHKPKVAKSPNQTLPPPKAVSLATLLAGRQVTTNGRTLMTVDPENETTRLNIKLAKQGEGKALKNELLWNRHLRRRAKALGLSSALPQAGPYRTTIAFTDIPIEVGRSVANQALRFGSQEFSLDTQKGITAGLAYRPPAGYQVYLNNPLLNLDGFRKSSDANLRDSAILAANGYYNAAPSDFLHNTGQARRYLWNADEIGPQRGNGAGHLHAFRLGVASPNFRASGLADFKHYLTAQELLARHPNREFFATSPNPQAVAHVSCLGDTLLSWALTVADSQIRRRDARRHSTTAIQLLDLSTEYAHGFATFLSAYTGLTPAQASDALAAAGIDFTRLARQVEYFCEGQYIAEVKEGGCLPLERLRELYGTGVLVSSAQMTEGRGYDADKGWVYDGKNPDLGNINGPLPLTELIGAIYWLTGLCCVWEA